MLSKMASSPGFALEIPIHLWKDFGKLGEGQTTALHGFCQQNGSTISDAVVVEAEHSKKSFRLSFLSCSMGSVFLTKLKSLWICRLDSLGCVDNELSVKKENCLGLNVCNADSELKSNYECPSTEMSCGVEVKQTGLKQKQDNSKVKTDKKLKHVWRSWFPSFRVYLHHVCFCDENPQSHGKEQLPHKCEECKMGTRSVNALRLHYRTVHKMKVNIPDKQYIRPAKFPCQYCQKLFRRRFSREEHEMYRCHLNVEKITPYTCPHCRRVFSSRALLGNHCASKHVSVEPYVCDICGTVCATYLRLYNHKLWHHHGSEPRYTCPVCSKGFWVKQKLERHLVVHKKVPSSVCKVCGKAFRSDDYLQAHIKSIHENRYKYRCDKCGHGMQKKSYVKAHICGRVRRPQPKLEKDVTSVQQTVHKPQCKEENEIDIAKNILPR